MSVRLTRQRAFTLVELLVVIGIIALLISILLPSLARARQSANTAAGLSNLRQIGLGLMMYADANQGYLPINVGPDQNWAVFINRYVGGNSDLYDPTNNPLSKVFQDPGAPVQGGSLHYTANPLLMPDITRSFSGTKLTKSFKLTQIKPRPTEISTVFDGAQMMSRGGSVEPTAWQMDGGFMFGAPSGACYMQRNDKDIERRIGLRANVDEGGGWRFPPGGDIRYRQAGDKACNMLFADGHAETKQRGEIVRGNIRAYKP